MTTPLFQHAPEDMDEPDLGFEAANVTPGPMMRESRPHRAELASDSAVRRKEGSQEGTLRELACGWRLPGVCVVGDATCSVAAFSGRAAREAFSIEKGSAWEPGTGVPQERRGFVIYDAG
ncbi:hypothetical protein NDU88_003667 [Pleurodeles waltl]|uniref:Uncharacterized protein n=1 Tax=Pleurodeles waltl TaxID=8319 RepID=A0AAV7PHJ7_PLEWA|nr:hypothetical protein NDU88_003667 [Pleurodeles waltl]